MLRKLFLENILVTTVLTALFYIYAESYSVFLVLLIMGIVAGFLMIAIGVFGETKRLCTIRFAIALMTLLIAGRVSSSFSGSRPDLLSPIEHFTLLGALILDAWFFAYLIQPREGRNVFRWMVSISPAVVIMPYFFLFPAGAQFFRIGLRVAIALTTLQALMVFLAINFGQSRAEPDWDNVLGNR